MALARLKNLAKLTLLLGAPVVVFVGLFSCGVYCGHEYRGTVLKIERDWLGMDVTVPGEPPKPTPSATTGSDPTKTTPTPSATTGSDPTKTTPTPSATTGSDPTKTTPTPTPDPVQTPPVPPTTDPVPVVLARVDDPLPFALPDPAPLTGDAQARFAEPVRIAVKVLVDPELASRRPDWLAYVQRNLAWASQAYEKTINLHLDLYGVVRLKESPRTPDELLAYPREGADLLLLLSGQTFQGPAPMTPPADTNAVAMIVQASPGSRAPHLRGLLHAVGQALGARAWSAGSEEWLAGSWMGDVRATDDRPLRLDAMNRMTLLTRKSYEFAVTPAPASTPEPEPEPEPDPANAPPGTRLPSVQDKDELPEQETR